METSAVALWGAFDVDDLDVQLRLRVARHELVRRGATTVRAFAPFGSTRPIAIGADVPVEPLTPVTSAHTAALREAFPTVVRCGDPQRATDGAYAEDPPGDPREIAAARALLTDPDGIVVLDDPATPHPALLMSRVIPHDVMQRRAAFLRALGWWPETRAHTDVHGPIYVIDAASDPAALSGAELLEAARHDRVVVVEFGAGGAERAEALTARFAAGHIPADQSGLVDRVAVLALADHVVSDDTAVRAAARAYRAPHAELAAEITALDAAYTEIATRLGLTTDTFTTELHAGEIGALRAALDDAHRRLGHERVALADLADHALRDAEARARVAEGRFDRTVEGRLLTIARRVRDERRAKRRVEPRP